MSGWAVFGYMLMACVMGYFIYRLYQSRPDMFSRKNIEKSFFSLGILAIIILGIIALGVYFLRH